MEWQTVKTIIIIAVIILVTGVLFFASLNQQEAAIKESTENEFAEKVVEEEESVVSPGPRKVVEEVEETENKPLLISPLNNPNERIRLKKHGDYITPENSPVSPERFQGYHAGVDMEVFPEELGSAVEVKAACGGSVIEKKWVNGYGGVLVMACELEGEAVTMLYGHLNISSTKFNKGDNVRAGEVIGNLGAENSRETDKERKHLHFSIHKGKEIELRGYVKTEPELEAWLDPCDYICI